MKLTQLNYYMEVCNNMNITRAAKSLHISQPSLTVAIKSLEEELGVSLLSREKNKISLTQEGQFFKEQLTPILKTLDNLERQMISIGDNHNTLKIGMPPMIGSFLFSLIFSKFNVEHPEIRLEIVEHGALKSQQLLLDEKLDLTLLIGESQLNNELIFSPICQQDVKLYIHQDHPLASSTSVSISDLDKLPLIMFNSEFYVSQMTKEAFYHKNIKPNIVLETSQISTVTRFVRENLAASILLDGCIPEMQGFKVIPIDELLPVTIGIANKRDRYVTSSTKKMMQFISAQDL